MKKLLIIIILMSLIECSSKKPNQTIDTDGCSMYHYCIVTEYSTNYSSEVYIQIYMSQSEINQIAKGELESAKRFLKRNPLGYRKQERVLDGVQERRTK